MHVRSTSSALLRATSVAVLAATFAACAEPTQLVAPDVAGPALDVAVADDATGYILTARGKGFAADFADRVAALGGTVIYRHDGVGFAFVHGLSADGAVALAARGDVASVDRDESFSVKPMAVTTMELAAADQIASVANPAGAARYSWQWNMHAINAKAAWDAGQLGDPSVTVAILDTGIDYDAPDLNGQVDLARSVSFIPADDAITTAFFPTRNRINDYNGHGTNVATQVSSRAAAVAGVTSMTRLMGVKVLSGRGSGSTGGVLSGILHAADNGADIANMSLGGGFAKSGAGSLVSLINRVFNYAKQQGMLIVVAAGNDELDLDRTGNLMKTYCDATHVVCVSSSGPETATAALDNFSYFSNYGSAVDVAAPGGNHLPPEAVGTDMIIRSTDGWAWGSGQASWVWSYCAKHSLVYLANGNLALTACSAGNRLTGMVGTSQAAPHVAGVAALLVPKVGKDRPAQLKAALLKAVDDLGDSGKDSYYGRGRINVAKALGL